MKYLTVIFLLIATHVHAANTALYDDAAQTVTNKTIECESTTLSGDCQNTKPEAVLLSSFAGKGLLGEGGATSIDVKPDVYCANIPVQISVTNWLVGYVPDAMTVTSIYCLVDAGTSVDLTPNECDGDGANCSAIEATITCGSTGQTIAQADIDNTDLDAGDTIRITRGTVTGAVNQAFICLTIEFDD